MTEPAYRIGVDFGTEIRTRALHPTHRSLYEIRGWTDVRLLRALKRIRTGKKEGP